MIVTGDHGEGLGERHWSHGWDLYNEDIRIPLLLYDVPATTYPDLGFAAQVDIAPTILDRLGVPIPASWEGRSLLAPILTRFTYHQTYFLPNRFAVLYRDEQALFKFIATPQYGKEELYDLARDRGEVRNLVSERPALASTSNQKPATVGTTGRDTPVGGAVSSNVARSAISSNGVVARSRRPRSRACSRRAAVGSSTIITLPAVRRP